MIILSTTLAGLGIGFGSVMGLSEETAEMVLFVITMAASFYGFASWLEEAGKSRENGVVRFWRNATDIREASLADYRWSGHG